MCPSLQNSLLLQCTTTIATKLCWFHIEGASLGLRNPDGWFLREEQGTTGGRVFLMNALLPSCFAVPVVSLGSTTLSWGQAFCTPSTWYFGPQNETELFHYHYNLNFYQNVNGKMLGSRGLASSRDVQTYFPLYAKQHVHMHTVKEQPSKPQL